MSARDRTPNGLRGRIENVRSHFETWSRLPSGVRTLFADLEAAITPEWQPISTAPKDGTEIIVGYDFASVWIVHVAFWRDFNPDMADMGWTEDDVGWWSYKTNSVTQEKLDGHYAPTHWMPLPKVPE